MTRGAERARRQRAVLAGACMLASAAVASAQPTQEARMNRGEVREALHALGEASGAEYVAIRQRLVAQGERILPWLADEERSHDMRRAVDASIVRMWIEHPHHIRACDGVLDRSIHVPSDYPHQEEGARVATLIRVGPILLPRLYEVLFRTGEYERGPEELARRVLRGLAFRTPTAQEPLRAAMGDPSIALQRRTEMADILWEAYSDPRTTAFAEALAWDEDTPPRARAWAINFLADRDDMWVLTLVHRLLDRPTIEQSVGWACVEAIGQLRDAFGAQRLLQMLIDRTWPDEIRSSMPGPVGDILGTAALPALRRIAETDPSERVREAASWPVIEMRMADVLR